MNCKTRGQKIDEFLHDVKVWWIRSMLIAWAIMSVIGLVKVIYLTDKISSLEKRVEYYEEIESKSIQVNDEDVVYIWHR